MTKNTILITGGNGFVGRALIRHFIQENTPIRIAAQSLRSISILKKEISEHLDLHCLQELDAHQWEELFKNVDTVIHCGAKTKLDDKQDNAEHVFMKANYDATMDLARKAALYGVRRFLFLSSMSVYGNMKQYYPFTENTALEPLNPYALSKLKAEEALMTLSDKLEIVIIRPPLIYGPGTEGNFKKLFQLIDKKIPLPLGAIQNKRHFLGINNLIDFIKICLSSVQAKNQIFIVADKEALSTTALIKKIADLMSKRSFLIPIPQKWLEFSLKIIGLEKIANQLLYNIEIDTNKAQSLLGWEPPYSMERELALAIDHFLKEANQLKIAADKH